MRADLDHGGEYVLSVTGPDRPGLTAAITSAVAEAGGNIVELGQQADPYVQRYGCRVAIEGDLDEEGLTEALRVLAEERELAWDLHEHAERPRIVICCSTTLHCVTDLIGRFLSGEMPGELVGVVSDKETVRPLVDSLGIPFRHLPVGDDRAAQEQALADVLEELEPELVVLARYMRILPGWITERFAGRMINIHHSTLPAFPGANPRRRAHEAGVKVIGATAHYVTEDLDQGPIIDQDVIRVGNHSLDELVARGEDVERIVLARAVRLHLDHRVMVFGRRTCVFD